MKTRSRCFYVFLVFICFALLPFQAMASKDFFRMTKQEELLLELLLLLYFSDFLLCLINVFLKSNILRAICMFLTGIMMLTVIWAASSTMIFGAILLVWALLHVLMIRLSFTKNK